MSDIIAAIMTAWPGARIKPITRLTMELTPQEITAILAASPAGGEYLEKLGKTDLAVLTERRMDVVPRGRYPRLPGQHGREPCAVRRQSVGG
jgi:hypothetical protein